MGAQAIGDFNAKLIESVALLQGRVFALEAERDQLAQKEGRKDQDILYYKERYELLQRQLFGKKSEKRKLDDGLRAQLLPGFDDALWSTLSPAAQEKKERETITYDCEKPLRRGTPIERSSRFPESLRRVKTVLEPEEKCCTSCGEEMEHVIRIEVTEQLCCSRDLFYVHGYHKPVYGCRACEEVAPVAEVPEVFERTSVDQSVVSYLLVNKFLYSLLVYRQWEIFRNIGLVFSNDALLNWVSKGLDLLRLIYQVLVELIVASRYLVADDTKLRAAVGGIAKRLPGYKQGALWGFCALKHDLVAYLFCEGQKSCGLQGGAEGFSRISDC